MSHSFRYIRDIFDFSSYLKATLYISPTGSKTVSILDDSGRLTPSLQVVSSFHELAHRD